ncbi:acyl-CoA carboxylase subunit epsilon [Corynebacterium suedekumii]|uniref:Acyl-CoA carboxylase subunit epsilon n=1 Tax=Corynebacterium suedekumii TaxID=3049801 RepID=A0ABY8VPP8_9CORY|nr:acyl-CoA carboxylase subunit epsilon [Corynebacterium suedekumii]WIM71609.1 acyl-CoA carboxylase subunit epsilon [Corynebacterium suedekumii]
MVTTTERPLFRVLKGNPDATELAALTAVLTTLAKQRPAEESTERNLWGRPEERLQRTTLYNPSAFRNVSFY